MKVHQKQRNITQNMQGASRNYRYVWDVSVIHFSDIDVLIVLLCILYGKAFARSIGGFSYASPRWGDYARAVTLIR